MDVRDNAESPEDIAGRPGDASNRRHSLRQLLALGAGTSLLAAEQDGSAGLHVARGGRCRLPGRMTVPLPRQRSSRSAPVSERTQPAGPARPSPSIGSADRSREGNCAA